MKDMKYVLGLDLGITSIGWALLGLDDDGMATHIIDANVSILDSMEDKSGKLANADRREARGARRTLRRRAYRVARVKKLFLDTFNLDLDSFYSHVRGQIQANPYTIKVKGLNELLTKEELAIALVHYAKHRGYRSNRKNDIKDSEAKVALTAISKNEKILEEKNITYSQYMINEFIENKNKYNYPKLKNSSDSKEYKYLFNRAIVKAEIEMFLDKQIEKGLINIDFKEKYIDIWSSQRDFSEGPGGNSPYSVDFAKAFGYCNFEIDGERKLRAPKCAPTTEIFTLLQKLNNIRYKSNENSDFQRLTKLELEKAVESAKNKTSIKYNDIEKIIGKKDIVFKGISLSKKDYIKVLNEYKDKNGLDKNIKISAIEHPIFKEMIEKETKKIKIFELKSFHKIKKAFKEKGASDIFDKMPIEYLDDVVTGLTFYKTDIRIKEYFSGDESNEAKISVSKLDWHIFPEVVDEIIPELDNFSDSASLSLELMRELNKELLLGLDYYEAMKKLGYDHSKAAIEVKKGKYFPSIDIIEKAYPNELTNPRVKKVLSYTMKTVNAIIKRYGSPHKINIEVARDIANGLQRRRDIENAMLDNYATNERLKQKILRDFSNKFSNFHNIKKADVEKIKLYEEQNGICMYSFEKIPYDMLFSNDLQVDHIIPYSRSFNDSFSNKTLVYTKANQEKGNKTPKEYFKNMGDDKWEKFNNYVLGNKKISKTKQSMY